MRSSNQHSRTSLLVSLSFMTMTLLLASSAAAGDTYLGITMSSLTPSMSRALKLEEGIGVLIDRVIMGSPAEQAGLESGDVIISMGNRTITNNRDLSRLVRESKPGDELRVTIQREGRQRQLKVTLGERPRRRVDGRGGLFDDMDIRRWLDGEQHDYQISIKEHVTKLTSGYLGVALDESYPSEGKKPGALVSKVFSGSPAEKADIQAGDLIVAIDGKDIVGHEALQQHLEQTRPGDSIELHTERNGKIHTFSIELAGVAERLGLSDLIKRFQSRDPSGTSVPPPAPPMPPKTRLPLNRRSLSPKLEEERKELEELREDLEELKEQLRKLREELSQRR